MSTFAISLLLLFTILATESSAAVPKSSTDFIKESCTATRYPALCVQSLSSYANEIQTSSKQLAEAAISVSLIRARSVSAFVTQMSRSKGLKPREYGAMRDCVDNMRDSVDRMGRSIKELGLIGGRGGQQEFIWHMSNVQTWVSAALTDVNTCADGFGDKSMNGNLKTAVTSRLVNVAQVTSNALALLNRFAEKHY